MADFLFNLNLCLEFKNFNFIFSYNFEKFRWKFEVIGFAKNNRFQSTTTSDEPEMKEGKKLWGQFQKAIWSN